MKCPLRSWRIASWLEASRRQRQTTALWATWTQAEPVSRLREEIIFLYSALWAIFSHCLVWGSSNTQKTPTNVRELSRGHWHDGAEAGGDELVQVQAGTALEGHNSTSSAYGDVTEKSRDGAFTAVQDRKGKNNRQKLKQEKFSLDTRQNFFPKRTVRQWHRLLRDTLKFQAPNKWSLEKPDLKADPVVGRRLGRDTLRSLPAFDSLLPLQSLSWCDPKYPALHPNTLSTIVP